MSKRNRIFLKTRKSAEFTELSAELADNSVEWTMNSAKHVKQIWQNLNFTNPNDWVLQKISSPVTLEFDLVFLHIFFADFYLFLKFWNNE
jgi:hypothetical protein